jgi:hypothetical protein
MANDPPKRFSNTRVRHFCGGVSNRRTSARRHTNRFPGRSRWIKIVAHTQVDDDLQKMHLSGAVELFLRKPFGCLSASMPACYWAAPQEQTLGRALGLVANFSGQLTS